MNIPQLTDLVNSKMPLITALDSSLFFDGSEDGGLEDGVSGEDGRAIKFWSRDPNEFWAGRDLTGAAKEQYLAAFEEVIGRLISEESVKHGYIFWVNPGHNIPRHKDDEDPSLRLVIGLNEPGQDYALEIAGVPPVRLKKNQCVELKAQTIEHGGWNRTDQIWSMLVLCTDKYDTK